MFGETTPKFPPEMFDAIIDALNGGDNDLEKLLGVCSLVCKSWLPRSRRRLFQKVTVTREERTEAKPFMDLLDSPLCTFKPYVHMLELQEGLDREPAWLGDALPRLSTLPTVRHLMIDDGIFPSPNSAKVLSNFRNLQVLVLDGCSFGSAAQLLETLSICTSLKSIGLYDLRISHSDSPGPILVNSLPPSSLRCVHTHSAGINNDLMEWLVSGEQVPAIETLALTKIQADESRAISHSLQRLGPSLKNLEVMFTTSTSRIDAESGEVRLDRSRRFAHFRYPDAFLHDVDLGYNTSLNSICLRAGPMASILSKVTSSEVREVVVDIAWALIERLRLVDWDTIARILDQPNFSKLERFIIPGAKVRDVREVRHWMMQRLLPGRARDKLILCEQWFENYP